MKSFRHHVIAGQDIQLYDADASHYGSDEEFLKKYWQVRPGEVAVDIGCGPGTWTLVALARGAWTFSFDPRLLAVEMLARHVVLNGYARAAIVPTGLWTEPTSVPFLEASFKGHESGILTRVTSLDEYFFGSGVLKLHRVTIDAEGSEVEIIRGGRKVLGCFKPDLFIEVHDGTYWSPLREELSALGYKNVVDDRKYLYAAKA